MKLTLVRRSPYGSVDLNFLAGEYGSETHRRSPYGSVDLNDIGTWRQLDTFLSLPLWERGFKHSLRKSDPDPDPVAPLMGAWI